MMSSKDSMALAVGQAMLDRIAASAPELSPSITLADYLPKGVTIDANPKAKA